MKQSTVNTSSLALLLALVAVSALATVEAGQGCPFDDGSCQEYCNQQGCNMGYCGHFAWIQCICRKCGDEWNWYDKVRYNPDKTVNQTELDSLKLNETELLLVVTSNSSAGSSGKSQVNQPAKATLTTLLIPDLSDESRLDMNDIPDENSDKFLDYLAKNHEKLVQATSARESNRTSSQTAEQQRPINENENDNNNNDDDDEAQSSDEQTTGSSQTNADDDTIEIQISTSNNNTSAPPRAAEPKQAQRQASEPSPGAESKSPITRLLKLAVMNEPID